MILARQILFATSVAALIANTTAHAQTRTLQVTVTDTAGAAVANADICVDSAQNGARLGEGRTDAAGHASVNVLADAAPSLSAPPVVALRVTASAGARGAAVQSGALAMVAVRLPGAGGPHCATGQLAQSGPGQFAIDSAALQARIAALPRPPGFEFVQLNMSPERCFGAAGMRCGDEPGQAGTCNPFNQTCTINVGSWKHDECCFDNPRGGMCGLNPAAPLAPGGISSSTTICQADFNMAAARLLTPFSWSRRIDFNRVNTTGTVDHAAYCAPAGTLMGEGEQSFCCSGRVRVLLSSERSGLSQRVLDILPARDIRACAA
jgi:hypothetical protein